jgi:hypothetical protein
MYRVELDNRDGLDDLVSLMANYAGASFEMHWMLMTDNDKLATSIAALMGTVVESDLPVIYPLLQATIEETGESSSASYVQVVAQRLQEMSDNLNTSAVETPAAASPQYSAWKKASNTCEFCDQPRQPRSKVCGNEECHRLLIRKHNQAYKARKAVQSEPAPVPEAATSDRPFAM